MPPDELPEPEEEPLPDDDPPLEEPLPHGPHVPWAVPLGTMHEAPGQQSELVVHPPPHATQLLV